MTKTEKIREFKKTMNLTNLKCEYPIEIKKALVSYYKDYLNCDPDDQGYIDTMNRELLLYDIETFGECFINYLVHIADLYEPLQKLVININKTRKFWRF